MLLLYPTILTTYFFRVYLRLVYYTTYAYMYIETRDDFLNVGYMSSDSLVVYCLSDCVS